MGSALLPADWRQVCGKPQHTEAEHTARCMNWICPAGQRYKTWPEVQAYFQLLGFEDAIPGVECRPENARRGEPEEDGGLTLEEAAAVKIEAAGKVKQVVGGEATNDAEADRRKRARKKDDEDEDYKPDAKDLKNADVKAAGPKRTRRSLPAGSTIKKVEPVERFPCGRCKVVLDSRTDLEVHTKNFHAGASGGDTMTLDEIVEVKKIVSTSQAIKTSLGAANNSVTISEVKKPEEQTNVNIQKLNTERFDVFKAFCVEIKVDPATATEKTVDQFLESLAKKKGINKSVQAGYRQAILKVQTDLKAQRRKSAPAPQTVQLVGGVARLAAPRPSAPRQVAPAARQLAPATRQAAPSTRQAAPAPRQATPSPRQATPRPRQPAPTPRQTTPAPRQAAPSPRQTTPRPAVRAVRPAAPSPRPAAPVRQTAPPAAQHSALPSYLAAQVSFPCRLEANAGGGESLYRAAAQHAGLGQDGCRDLRRYCHAKLLEWWQWYEPYYAFPLQVKVRVKAATVQRVFPSAATFKEFLKGDESLGSYNVSECETYCLANVLGVPIHQLTYNLATLAGARPEQRCKWDTLEPHQGLVHQNRFVRNKQPLYVLHEDKGAFTRIVQAPK